MMYWVEESFGFAVVVAVSLSLGVVDEVAVADVGVGDWAESATVAWVVDLPESS